MGLVTLSLGLPRLAQAHEPSPPAPVAPNESPAQREVRELEAALTHEEHEEHAPGEATDAWLARNRRLVALYHEQADRPGEARALTRLALAQADLGDSIQAAALLEEAHVLCRGSGAPEADVLNWLGFMYLRMGDYQRALARLQEGLPIARAHGSPGVRSALLGNLGALYSLLKEEQQALRYKREALALVEHTDDPDKFALMHNVGVSYAFVGDRVRALTFFQRARAGWHSIGDRANEGLTLTLIGQIYRVQGRTDEALRALRRAQTLVATGDRQTEINTSLELGYTYAARGELDEARRQYEAAFASLKSLDRAGHIDAGWWIPLALARLETKAHRLPEARAWIDTAIAVVEASRTALVSPGLRTGYTASVDGVYKADIEILMAQHAADAKGDADRAALEVSERSRARTLVDTLSGARVDLHRDADPALAEPLKTLYDRLDAKADLQMRRQQAGQTEAGRALDDEIRQITADVELLRGQIREKSPHLGNLEQPLPTTANEIQSLLDPDTALLEYSLGHNRSYLWVVTDDAIRAYTLPRSKPIEALARRLHQSITARNHVASSLDAAGRLAAVAAAETAADRAATLLGEILLGAVPRPSQKRLVVVADGGLHYVPFAALRQPKAWGRTAPLLADYEVTSLPSAAVLAVQRRELAARPPASKPVLVLADPVFDRRDPRVSARARSTSGASAPAASALNRFREGLPAPLTLPRLSFSHRLVDGARDVDGAVGFAANRSRAMDASMADYRTVIFATHGILNGEYPELSGVVLSLVDENGEPQKGFLRLHDVYDMKLNAEAVVLAACETGLGKEMKGEGLLGLSRGFLYAGARRVVATLWQVDEEATVELIRGLLQNVDAGEPYAAALRKAQLRVRDDPRWRAPYFWAGVTLQGEWR